jgi:two-component system, NtrC family, C4-dicarboxylate transport response regulator DctD
MEPNIRVVDDNDDNRATIPTRLQICGYSNISLAADEKSALERMRSQTVDLVLLDVLMPGLDGSGVLQIIKDDAFLRDVPVVMVSAIDGADTVAKCIDLGAVDYLTKPLNPVALREENCIQLRQLRDASSGNLDAKLVGTSSAAASLRREILHIANTTVPVLINGETGSGKEVVAQCLHSFSARSAKRVQRAALDGRYCALIP